MEEKLNKFIFELKDIKNAKMFQKEIMKQNSFLNLINNKLLDDDFFKKNRVYDFDLYIDGFELEKLNNTSATYVNKDLLSYLFFDSDHRNPFYFGNCDCGIPECAGYDVVPYIVFFSNNKKYIQFLLREKDGYKSLIKNIKKNNLNYNQKINIEDIVIQNRVIPLKKEGENVFISIKEKEIALTFSYNEIEQLKEKIVQNKNFVLLEDIYKKILHVQDDYVKTYKFGKIEIDFDKLKQDVLSNEESLMPYLKTYSNLTDLNKNLDIISYKKIINDEIKKERLYKKINKLIKDNGFEHLKLNHFESYEIKTGKKYNFIEEEMFVINIYSVLFDKYSYLKRTTILKKWNEIKKEIIILLNLINDKNKDKNKIDKLFKKTKKEIEKLKDKIEEEKYLPEIEEISKTFKKELKENKVFKQINKFIPTDLKKFYDDANIFINYVNYNCFKK